MNLLNLRTEYSFRTAFGRVANILDKAKALGSTCAGICDTNGTWGHVVWQNECKKRDLKPIFGVELAVVEDARIKEKQPPNYMSFIAKTNHGLKCIYELVTASTENFYYIPRIDYSDIEKLEDVFIFIGRGFNFEWPVLDNMYLDLKPITPSYAIRMSKGKGIPPVAFNDNFYVNPEDRDPYEIALGRFKNLKTVPMHIMGEDEWLYHCRNKEAVENANLISEQCNVELPKAEMVEFKSDKTLRELCEERAKTKDVDLSNDIYKERLDKELFLIREKRFEDYFFVIWDLLKYAKQHMLVGPARGSSCGSLVCYLLDITEIDPMPHGLIFERFIDVNRLDMPDIDIDFPDNKRDMVFDYLKEKYGNDCVARLGSVNKFQAKSCVLVTSKELDIPPWDVKDFKENIIERREGDERADYCIADTFKDLEIGKETLEKFPHLKVAERIEGHASHSGQHAAGIVVTKHPISHYCSIDMQTGCVQLDKRDAEVIDLLKIDALGLRNLTVIEDCLSQIGWSYEKILRYPITDKNAYKVIQDKKYSGVFQFEGQALKSICSQMRVENFDDIAAITALARPGPLDSGGTKMYVDCKNGNRPVYYPHELMEPILNETYGIIVYQEQVMSIVREIGGFTWSDTTKIRKAVSKSLGSEIINKYKEQFVEGGKRLHDIDETKRNEIFENICTFGSYGFNKSHAVAYAKISYWCMVLKYYFPLEFAVASLRHSGTGDKREERCIKLLRELDKEGVKYKPFDKDKSLEDWSYADNIVLGGLTNIKGVGKKVAADIVRRRKKDIELTNRQLKLLNEGVTPFDMLYEGHELFGDILENPEVYNIKSHIYSLDEIEENMEGEFLIMAKIVSKSIRDENEQVNIEKRKTRAAKRGENIGDGIVRGQTIYLNIKVEDDTGNIIYVRINRNDYKKMGVKLVNSHKDGDWFLWKGNKIAGINMLFISRYRFLGNRDKGCVISPN